jgi:hypothetical protein
VGDTLGQTQPPVFPPSAPTTMTALIPSYLYQQYADDDNLHAFVNAYNIMAKWFVDWFNQINLAYYPTLRGDLLDWVAGGLYGMQRPSLSMQTFIQIGGYNTAPYDTQAYDEATTISTPTFCKINDDIFCRMITWHHYKGDGYLYSTRWLKRRVHRFLNGPYGVAPDDDTTFDVSVSHSGTTITINVLHSYIAETLEYAIADGVLRLPLQYTYQVKFVTYLGPVFPTGAVINGVGQLRATGELLKFKLAGATIGGVGNLRATPIGTSRGGINGVGTLRVIDLNVRLRGAVTARLVGTGNVQAFAKRMQYGIASLAGIGSFTARPMMFTVVNNALTLVQVEPTWPTSPTGLPKGAVYRGGASGLTVMVVPGVLPNPAAAPLYYTTTTPAQLLALGGGNLPLTNPGAADQLWNNGGIVVVAGRAANSATAVIHGSGALTVDAHVAPHGLIYAAGTVRVTGTVLIAGASARIPGSGSARKI